MFAQGIVLYYLLYGKDSIKMSSKQLMVISITLLVGLAAPQTQLVPEIFYYGLAFLVLVIALRGIRSKLLFNLFFLYIGEISYTLYLSHWAVIYFVRKFKLINLFSVYNEPLAVGNFILNYGIILTFSIAISTLLHYTIERPMQTLGKKLSKKRVKPALDAV
ncbi:acyltransferase family protein [Mucilaginibacter psychrotolerans]|uniref:Acyltransferase n=1 Tax=Mucilaginibacter psychrotolerans TaxID=1524096 RepID=A0A4Y8S3A2_9SPHI|nr:acyltransferase [Mucilaginibacter psychrotolerans]TFF32165.1 acyltransferase [Mucilaginibacter psychrotolerans]